MKRNLQSILAATMACTMLGGCASLLQPFGLAKSSDPMRSDVTLADVFGQKDLEEGRAFMAQGHYGRAIQSFQRAALNPQTAAAAYNGLGVAYAKIGRGDLAERFFRQANAVEPGNAKYMANLDRFYASPLAASSRAVAVREGRPAPAMQTAQTLAPAPVPVAAVRLAGGITIERPAGAVNRVSPIEIRIGRTNDTTEGPVAERAVAADPVVRPAAQPADYPIRFSIDRPATSTRTSENKASVTLTEQTAYPVRFAVN